MDDYFGLMGGQDNIGGVQAAVKSALFNQNLATQNQAQEFDLQKQHVALMQMVQDREDQKALWGELVKDPNAKNAFAYISRFPQHAEPITKAWGMLDGKQQESEGRTIADAAGALNANNAPLARQILVQRRDADQAAGMDTSHYDGLIAQIDANPQNARAMANLVVAATIGKDKLGDVYKGVTDAQTDEALRPAKVAEGNAKARSAQVEAQYAPAVQQSNLATAEAQRTRLREQTANEQAEIQLRREGLVLERDKLQSTIQLELGKLDRAGVQLDAGARSEVNKAVGDSVASDQLADRMQDLADQIGASPQASGWKAVFYEKAKGAFGNQDEVSGLRAQYNQLVNSQAVKNLPPGPASDKDIALAKQGFPPDSADPQYMAQFLRGMGKMQRAVAAASDRRANWISANGSLAPAQREMQVGGTLVPKGATFSEFNKSAAGIERRKELPPALSALANRYRK